MKLYRAKIIMVSVDTSKVSSYGASIYYEAFEVSGVRAGGCWIKVKDINQWVSILERKRFAYPTREEAFFDLLRRKEAELKKLIKKTNKCTKAILEMREVVKKDFTGMV